MAASKKNSDGITTRRSAPAVDPEARENQLINLAVAAAERELMKDKPSPQVIVHYLRLASTKAQLEKEKLRKENKLLEAKTDAIVTATEAGEKYAEAIRAMQIYQGSLNRGDDYE